MKKLLIAGFLSVFGCCSAFAEVPEDAFFEDVLLSEDIKEKEDSDSARSAASRLLDRKPTVVKIEGQPMPFRRYQPPEAIDTSTKYGEAPFGLAWGATYKQTKALGADLAKETARKDANSFTVTKLPKPLTDFARIIVSFGEDNKLWRIVAYGEPQNDDASASEILRIYRRYYKLLNQKYGNAQEFFTPKISILEKTVKDDYGREKTETYQQEEPMGGKNFLQELQNREAALHATFEDSDVGAALTVSVNGDGKSYIIIDYTNLKIYREREAETLNAL